VLGNSLSNVSLTFERMRSEASNRIGEIEAKVALGAPLKKAMEEEYFRFSKPMIEELVYAGRIARIAYRFQRFSYNWGKKGALKTYYRLLRGEESYKKLFFKAWLHLI